MNNGGYTNIILEDINGKFDRLLEVVLGLKEQLDTKADKSDIEAVNQRLTVIEYSLKTNHT